MMNSLGQTQRAIIREHAEIELAETAFPDQVDVRVYDKDEEDKEKKVSCLPKCFLLGFVLLLLLAGMITLIVKFKENKADSEVRGTIQPDLEIEEECLDLTVVLGSVINIKCTFHQSDVMSGAVEAVYRNLAGAKPTDFNCIKVGTTVNCRAKERTKCSSHGGVLISFFDKYGDDKKVVFTKTVNIKVTVPDRYPETSISQEFDNDTSQSEFQLTCLHKKDCASYEMGFYGNGYNLADSKTCTTSFSDDDGYTVSCSATVPSEVIYDHGNGSLLYCQLMHGSDVKKQKELVLPLCHDIPFSSANCRRNTTSLFDCDDTIEVEEDCTKKCSVIKACFSARHQEIVDTNSVLCPTKCALKWCRNEGTLEIDNSGDIPFKEHLCT